MKKYFLILLSVILLINFSPQQATGQTHTVTYDVDWMTANQNMWGPNGSPFTINMDIDLFDIAFGDTSSVNAITTIFGAQFGMAFTIGTWLELGSTFSLHGFTTGSIDVDYPTTIDLTFPNNYTFNPGSTVTINSDYTVDPGWALDSYFPSAGIAQLDLFFGFGLFIDVTVCVFSCTSFTPININIPTDSINIFYLNSQTGEVSYPWFDPTHFPPFYIVHDTILPIYFSIPQIGLTGWIDIPYIITNDWLDANDLCLYATGEDHWLQLDIDVIQLLSAIAGLIPPPTGPAIQQFLSYLSGTIDLGGGFTIDYTLLAMTFGIGFYMQQDLSFCPKIWTTFTMPTSVPYTETDPAGAIVNQGDSNIITILVGNNLNFQYPCFGYPTWDMGIRHWMTNDFRNHTWDSLAFDFTITAFEFWINIPFPVLPDFCVPAMCIDVPVQCPEDYGNADTCYQQLCTGEICTPQSNQGPQPDWTIHIGPLFQMTFPLGYIPITWYDDTWELAGFTPDQTNQYHFDTIVPNHQIIPNPPLIISLAQTNPIICFGDTTGQLTVTVTNGTPPYTYEWSTGDSTTTTALTNSISNLGTGTYSVTVTDVNGCTLSDTMSIANVDPPLYIVLEPTNVTCVGGSDGQIIAHVTGGTPGYTYLWTPIGGNDSIADSLPKGTYTVYVTDLLGCHITDSATLIELYPLPPVDFYGVPTEGCQPLRVQFYETNPDEGQTYWWNFHDQGITDIDKNPFHIFENAGIYDITCVVTSIHGCVDSLTIDSMITVYPKPVASFTAKPEEADILEPYIFFDNSSDTRYAQYWLFGDGETSTEFCPVHQYIDSGYFNVVLYIATEYGCKDTANGKVYIKESITFYAPNAFTPDKNGNNEVFITKGTGIDLPTFELNIYDRWGKLIFKSTDIEVGWDGKIKGTLAEPGVYNWMVYFKDIVKRKHRYRGSVMLLR